MILLLTCIFTLTICGAVSADETTNMTADIDNSTNSSNTSYPDPIISGVVLDNSTHTGLADATVQVRDTNGNILAETLTNNDGTYSVNFINTNTVFTVIASKMNYTINVKEIIVTPSSDPDDPNFYGTANFLLYGIPDYSGSASSYVLNVGALPAILLDIYAGRSSAWVNSATSPYVSGEGIPLEVRLLSGSLLAGLLNVNSTGDQGSVTGGLLPDSIPSLEAALQSLGLDVGLLNGSAYSSTNPLEANGGSSVASLELAINLLLLNIPIADVDLITGNSSVVPNINNSIVTSTSSAGVTNISILGGVLEIEALQSNATASVTGQPGGANADFDWSVVDIKLLGVSILDNLRANLVVELPGVLRISLGGESEIAYADGTYARASGDVLNVELLGILLGGIRLTIGHAEAEAQIPAGGLIVETDLEINKTVDNSNPNYGQNIIFTLTAHNNGPDAATNVTVTDPLPQGLTFMSSNGAYDPATGVWTIGDLASGATAILQIIAQVTAYGTMNNIAVINGDEPDQNITNNQDNVTVITNAADLEIAKVVDNSNPNYGQNVIFTLTARNNGPDTATNVTVNDALPAGLTFVQATGNGTYDSTNGIWTIGSLTNGTTAILQIIAQVTSYGTMTNIAVINGDEPDQNDTNDEDEVNVTTNAADLSITKTVDNSNPNYGDQVTFTLTAHNYGPDNATGVIVTDTLPAGLTFVSANGYGSYLNGIWHIGDLANGTTVILNIIAQVTDYATMTNIAVISGDEADQNNTNNQDDATVTTNIVSDLAITKAVDRITANFNDILHYTITVTNNGSDPATNFTVNDLLPGGLTFQSVDTHGIGTYDQNTGVWTVNTALTNGESATLDIFARIIQSDIIITNTASVNNPNDPNPNNDQDTTITTVNPLHDLEIIKTVDKVIANLGEELNYTLTIINHGPDTANNIQVTDVLPSGLQLISTDGTYSGGIITWIISTLQGNNAQIVLHVQSLITQSGITLTNTATVDQTNDPDTTNNEDTIITNVNPVHDLAITKTVDKPTVIVGETVIFTIIVRNNGPDAASDVQVVDRLPAGLEFISANSTRGTYNSETGVWNIGTISNGAFETITIEARTLVSGTLINEAEVEESIYDPNLENNRANATFQVNELPDTPDIPTNPDTPNTQPPVVRAKTIPMKETGIPLGGILMAVLLVFAGMLLPKRK